MGEVNACLGVPPRKASGSGFPLQVRALITGLAGFPLQSVTQKPIDRPRQEAV